VQVFGKLCSDVIAGTAQRVCRINGREAVAL
jgi:hypothetical protein